MAAKDAIRAARIVAIALMRATQISIGMRLFPLALLLSMPLLRLFDKTVPEAVA